jgi:hypothetical protein
MEKLFDKNDDIGRLVREEGLLTTSPDFTSRVMNIVNASPQRVQPAYKPLLSKGTWIFILFGLLSLAVISPFAVASEKVTDITFLDRFKPAVDFLNGIHFSIKMAPNTLMLATMILASAALLLVLDYFLNRLKMEE